MSLGFAIVSILIITFGLINVVRVWVKYQPYIDITREGDVLLWHNKNGERVFRKLFNIFFKK